MMVEETIAAGPSRNLGALFAIELGEDYVDSRFVLSLAVWNALCRAFVLHSNYVPLSGIFVILQSLAVARLYILQNPDMAGGGGGKAVSCCIHLLYPCWPEHDAHVCT